jgi:GNAT superfamily N-acetyltransferase
MLEEALELNRRIFGENEKYGSQDCWLSKLQNNGRIYLETGKGFLVIHDRPLDGTGDDLMSEHIWLAGVLPTARNEGIMKALFRAAIIEMKLPLVTIRTGPAFPEMENWIIRLGFHPRAFREEDRATLYEIPLVDLRIRLGVTSESN